MIAPTSSGDKKLTFRRNPRWYRALLFGLAIIRTVSGCGWVPTQVCAPRTNEDVQVSPSRRAVAFVDPDAHASIVDASAIPDLNCAVDGYLSRFTTRPEGLAFVLDFEDRVVTRSRLVHERGFHFFGDLSGDRTPEEITGYERAVREAKEIEDQLPPQPIWAFNARYRDLETGTGGGDNATCSSDCPDFLRGYFFLPTKEDLVAGRLLHEFAHFWAAHLAGPSSLADQLRAHNGHWGFTSVGGQLGGWRPGTLLSFGDEWYAAKAAPAGRAINRLPYAPLELYLMGLAPPGEVEPLQVAVNVSDVSSDEHNGQIFRADRIDTVTIDDIVAANGPRTPAYSDAPREFTLALIVIADHRFSDAEWDFYERAMDFLETDDDADLLSLFPEQEYPGQNDVWTYYSGHGEVPLLNFFSATRGRGRLRFAPVP